MLFWGWKMVKGGDSYKGLWPTLIILETLFLCAMWLMGQHTVAVKSFFRPLVDYLLPQIASLI